VEPFLYTATILECRVVVIGTDPTKPHRQQFDVSMFVLQISQLFVLLYKNVLQTVN